jgi:hypothetical protein
MSTSQSIQGLIKWSQREEWRGNLEAVLERHVGPACRVAGIGLEELAEIIGDHWMSTLWGCAFEDLVSAGRAERNVADDYLKRRGWKESAGTRAYIEALRRSSMSLYEVSDIVGGVSFLARDLVRGGDPVQVFERSATQSLTQWDRIAARVVTVLGRTQITGSVLPFSHQLAEETLASIERVRKKAREEAEKLARSLGRNVDDSAFGLVTGVDEVLAGSAFMFSNLWLDDVLGLALNPSLPQMQNTDGEPLEFITIHFPLVSKSNPPAIRAALDDLPPLRKESDAFWNWVEENKALRRKSAKGHAGDTQTFGATMDDGAIVLGNVELTAKAVTLSVNSEARAARGRALLEPVLAGLVRAPLVERQTVEQMMALSRDRPNVQDALRIPPDEERRIIHQTLTDHYRRTLDEPIPSLGNQSPRKAAKTGKGREKVIGWLKMLENQSARQGRDDPVGSYDFTWIWKELGLGDERR